MPSKRQLNKTSKNVVRSIIKYWRTQPWIAEHIVNLYDADVQAMRQEIISSGMFKTILDIMIEKDLTTSEEVDTKLAENIKAIEDAYNEQYAKFQEYVDSIK